MKKITLIALVMFLGVSMNMNAQKNVVKFRPFSLIFTSFKLDYERVLSSKSSIQVTGLYRDTKFGDLEFKGIGAGAQFRFYPGEGKEAPEGLFIGPSASFAALENNVLGKNLKADFGVVIGHQWNFNPITLDIFAGPAYFINNTEIGEEYDLGTEGFSVTAGLGVGFAFQQ